MARVHHMVLFRWKEGTSSETIADLFGQLADLPNAIPGIEHFSGGPYASSEGLNQRFQHGFLMIFENAAARDAYLPHPAHEAVKQQLLAVLDQVVAFDYEVDAS